MITYEEALKKAKALKPTADNCIEYDNAYIFGCREDSNYDGTYQPCVILREDGRALNMVGYILKIGVGKKVREFDL